MFPHNQARAATRLLQLAIVGLALCCAGHAQVDGGEWRSLVQSWVNDAKPLLSSASRANSDMASAFSKLDRKIPGEVRQSSAWQSLQQNQSKFETTFRAFSQALQKGISIDEQYLRQLNRNAGIESDSVSENLKARVEMQQSLAQASAAFLGLLKEMDESLRALPENVASTGEFVQLKQTQNIMHGLLDGSAKQFTARAARYASMGKAQDGSSATYNIPFGNAGALTIEYAVRTTRQYSLFKNTVSGTISNATKLPLQCVTIEPSASDGRSMSLLTITGIRLQPGSSQPFSRDDIASTTSISTSGISAWKATCRTPIAYTFVAGTVSKSFPEGNVIGVIGRTQIGVTVENNSGEPIEISWNESSFIDTTRSAKRIFHSGVKYADREQSLPNTIVPPLARVEDAAIPSANVYFVEGQYGGWRENPLFPTDISPELIDQAVKTLRGAKVALFLQLMVNGKKTPVTLLFEVADVGLGRLN